MAVFWKAIAAVLIAVTLGLALKQQEKDISLLLSLAMCCMAGVVALRFLEPMLDLLWELEAMGSMESSVLGVLMKAVGIALVTEISGTICTDAGNSSLGKTVQILGSAAVLFLSVPIIRSFLELIQEILGKL